MELAAQVEHKEHTKKKKHVPSIIQLCALFPEYRRISSPSLSAMWICKAMLGVYRGWHSSWFRIPWLHVFPQGCRTLSVLYGSNNSNLLGNLDYKKCFHFLWYPTRFNGQQKSIPKGDKIAHAKSQCKILPSFWPMDTTFYLNHALRMIFFISFDVP